VFLSPFIYYLKNLNNIEIQIFVTKSNNIDDEIFNLFQIFYKKPNIFEHVSLIIKSNKNIKKTCIIYCGSESLLQDVYYTSTHFGIEIFNETFT
jgi:hypothetical protein